MDIKCGKMEVGVTLGTNKHWPQDGGNLVGILSTEGSGNPAPGYLENESLWLLRGGERGQRFEMRGMWQSVPYGFTKHGFSPSHNVAIGI